ncbi:DUF2063 domain-containing protein [Alginatibacterium sediminis]|uniref:DUF2063 domain-containing protein n=1 Tax=Alginatibacterium sediminis TaxID=2164068 RepID=A0A420EBS8_9ALTE|nr:DNA-binding domain-containing protein [Alginatibacterium sediminis]RKF18114.1 DUF2063 domain-containing protein [Alginatibacterium sediminis]
MKWLKQQRQFVRSLLENDTEQRQAVATSWATLPYGIEIYRNNVFASLSSALKDNFPNTIALVGDEFFTHLAKNYVEHYGCNTPCVVDYGELFPQFLSEQAQLASLPYVSQIAYLEQKMRRCAQCPIDQQMLGLKDLNRLSEQQLTSIKFRLASHAQLLNSHAPVLSLYRFIQDQQQMPPDLLKPELVLLVKQVDFGVTLTPVSTGVFDFLNRLSSGLSLAEVVEFDSQNGSTLLLEAIGLDCIAYKD